MNYPQLQFIAEKYPLHFQRIVELCYEFRMEFIVEKHGTKIMDIVAMFLWCDTDEGSDYWRKLCNEK